MIGNIIDGKLISEKILFELSEMIKDEICVVFIQVGDNNASNIYVRNKIKACDRCGITHTLLKFNNSISENELIDKITNLNNDNSVHGIMVQLPLPNHINESVVKNHIIKEKDIDGFNMTNLGGSMVGNLNYIIPATPYGILELIKHYKIPTEGKNVVVIGRSEIVGRPIMNLLSTSEYNSTVTLCHSKSKDIKKYTINADIIICAVGKPKILTKDMVKDGVIIFDVGINRDDNNKLCGDCDFNELVDKASMITPVPGGVGPMTVACLIKNIYKCYKLNKK